MRTVGPFEIRVDTSSHVPAWCLSVGRAGAAGGAAESVLPLAQAVTKTTTNAATTLFVL